MSSQVVDQQRDHFLAASSRSRRGKKIVIPDDKFYSLLKLLDHYQSVYELCHLQAYSPHHLFRVVKLRKYTYRDTDSYDHEVTDRAFEFYQELLKLVHGKNTHSVDDPELIYNLHFTLRFQCGNIIYLKKSENKYNTRRTRKHPIVARYEVGQCRSNNNKKKKSSRNNNNTKNEILPENPENPVKVF